ncbi:hypothetical protein [Halocola ammonii]
MKNKEFLIKIENEGVSLTPQIHIPIESTNIPHKDLTFRLHKPIFWKVGLEALDSGNKSLLLNILDYDVEEVDKFDKQRSKNSIKQIHFTKFNWPDLEPLLTRYQPIKLKEIVENIDVQPRPKVDVPTAQLRKFDSESFPAIEDPIIDRIVTVTKDFSEISFADGKMVFSHFFDEIQEGYELDVKNETIKKEFDTIKTWFKKALKIEKIKVSVKLSVQNGTLISVSTQSDQIDRITPELIDSVKLKRTLELTKESQDSNPDRTLFTSDDIFESLSSEESGQNVFNQTEEDLLWTFVQEKGVRNQKQLEYLALKRHNPDQKLRFTLHPHFGFLFTVTGANQIHFIWELLESHATYVWSFDRDVLEIEEQYRRMEEIIGHVHSVGRNKFKQHYKQGIIDSPPNFKSIHHTGKRSAKDVFTDWKVKLNEVII